MLSRDPVFIGGMFKSGTSLLRAMLGRHSRVVRDPRDVYASMVEIGKWTEPAVFANHWRDTVGAARDWRGSRRHPAYHELRYEKLVLAPDATMREALAFLGEPWEPEIAMFDGRPQDLERVQRATGKLSATLRRLAMPLTDSRIGVWAEIVGEEGWEPISAELNRRGYERLVAALIAETDAIAAEVECSGGVSLVGSKP